MIKVTNIKAVRLLGVLLILLSGDAFAVKVYATQDGLDTEISNRKSADTAEVSNRNKAIGTAIGTEVTNRNTAITTEKKELL